MGDISLISTPSAYPQYQQSSSSSSINGSSSSGSSLSALSTYYTNLVNDHFIGYLPKLVIVDGYKYVHPLCRTTDSSRCHPHSQFNLTPLFHRYFQPSIHISITSTSTASTIPAIFIALRTAFYDLRIPRVKRVGWEGVAGAEGGRIGVDVGMGVGLSANLSGGMASGSAMKNAMTSGKGGKGNAGRLARSGKERVGPGEDWELDTDVKIGKGVVGDLEDDGDEDGLRLLSVLRRGLPICVTLNLVSGFLSFFLRRCESHGRGEKLTPRIHQIPEPTKTIYFLDATPAEELACSSRLHVFFCSRPSVEDGKRERLLVCGTRVEGGQGVKIEMIPALLKVRSHRLYQDERTGTLIVSKRGRIDWKLNRTQKRSPKR
jgi:hypothetical protein